MTFTKYVTFLNEKKNYLLERVDSQKIPIESREYLIHTIEREFQVLANELSVLERDTIQTKRD